jgi:hypothetical protein
MLDHIRCTVFLYAAALSFLEILATCLLGEWIKKNEPMYVVTSVGLFASIGMVLGYCMKLCYNTEMSMNNVNLLWQSSSMVILSIWSVGVWEESMSLRQIFGVVFSIISLICFI